MAIKYRDGRPYYYKSVREGKRVASRYVGSGDLAIARAVLEAAGYHRRDLAGAAEKALAHAAGGKNLAFKEGLARRLQDLRAELAGPRPTAIERLLAERAAFCWLAVYKCELDESRSRERTLVQADFQRRRIDSAHRRYLSSLKTLATVRKLTLPSLQVNVAENQVVGA